MTPASDKPPVIDIHGHINLGRARKILADRQPSKVRPGGNNGLTDKSRGPILTDVDARLADMDGMGVDMMLLTPSPPSGYYRADESLAGEVSRAINDDVAKIARDHADRLLACGNVALQHVEQSCAELTRGMQELGLKGMRISTNIARAELGDRKFDPFWARAEKEGALIMLHPQGFTEPERLEPYFMTNAVGQPLETTLALAQMIFGGVFERFPKLKLCAAHGGGYFPFYLGRFEQSYRERAECRVNISKSPAEYLRNIWFDTVVFRPDAIGYLADVVGADRIMLGTDSPFDMGEKDPVGLIKAAPGLSDAQKADMLGGSAARLLGIAA
jgi:aminocarboxymuconate-semialdehyde decarboxylase